MLRGNAMFRASVIGQVFRLVSSHNGHCEQQEQGEQLHGGDSIAKSSELCKLSNLDLLLLLVPPHPFRTCFLELNCIGFAWVLTFA